MQLLPACGAAGGSSVGVCNLYSLKERAVFLKCWQVGVLIITFLKVQDYPRQGVGPQPSCFKKFGLRGFTVSGWKFSKP